MQVQLLAVNGQYVKYAFVADDEECDISVSVAEDADQGALERAVSAALVEKYWSLSQHFAGVPVKASYVLLLGASTKVMLYDFRPGAVYPDEIRVIAQTCDWFYNSLRDKSLWNCTSIQIRPTDELNRKSGEGMRGREVISQKRFELFPTSFASGDFRGVLPCTWLEGSVIHELTHVLLKQTLFNEWAANRTALGWVNTPLGISVQLPGGSIAPNGVMLEPSRCPTEYARYQWDDDAAESAVAYFVDRERLDEVRAQILGRYFLPDAESSYLYATLYGQQELLPPVIRVKRVLPKKYHCKFGRSESTGVEVRTVPLEDYLAEIGVR